MAYTAWSVVYGEQPTAAKWNQLGANDAGFKDGTNIDNDAIINRHVLAQSLNANKIDATTRFRAKAYMTSDKNIAASAPVPYPQVIFDATEYNVGTLWSAGSPTRFTIPAGGKGIWLFLATVGFAGATANSRRGFDFYKNGAAGTTGDELNFLFGMPTTATTVINGAEILSLNAGDYVQLGVYQDSGGSLAIAANRTSMTAILLQPLP